MLKSLEVKKGDRVALYMGMCPELAVAVLACARIGAVHSVIFGGFAAHAIADRVNDAGCRVVVTQDLSYRRGTEVKLKQIVDEAISRWASDQEIVVPVEPIVATPALAPMKVGTGKRFIAKQEEIQFESTARGRFEKTHETIYNGENLDQPTFRRRRLAIRL